jgi:hypothetical protein
MYPLKIFPILSVILLINGNAYSAEDYPEKELQNPRQISTQSQQNLKIDTQIIKDQATSKSSNWLQGLWENKGLINHTLSDGLTVAARLAFSKGIDPTIRTVVGGVAELIEAPYRWLSGSYMWYETQQQLKEDPSNTLLHLKNSAIYVHLATDAIDVLTYYTPGIFETTPGGAVFKAAVNIIQGGSQALIIGLSIYDYSYNQRKSLEKAN